MYIEELLQELTNATVSMQKSIEFMREKSNHELIEKTVIMKNDRETDELLAITEVAKLLRCNRNYVGDLLKAGLLPYLKLGSRKIRRKAFEEFMQKYEGWDLTDPYNPRPIIAKGD